VHYSTGLAGLAAVGGASLMAERGLAAPLARFLLEASGALFGLYLVVMIVLSAAGARMRRSAAASRGSARHAAHLRPLPASRHVR
jgi:preprotein translocase subunit SecG